MTDPIQRLMEDEPSSDVRDVNGTLREIFSYLVDNPNATGDDLTEEFGIQSTTKYTRYIRHISVDKWVLVWELLTRNDRKRNQLIALIENGQSIGVAANATGTERADVATVKHNFRFMLDRLEDNWQGEEAERRLVEDRIRHNITAADLA